MCVLVRCCFFVVLRCCVVLCVLGVVLVVGVVVRLVFVVAGYGLLRRCCRYVGYSWIVSVVGVMFENVGRCLSSVVCCGMVAICCAL